MNFKHFSYVLNTVNVVTFVGFSVRFLSVSFSCNYKFDFQIAIDDYFNQKFAALDIFLVCPINKILALYYYFEFGMVGAMGGGLFLQIYVLN